MNIVRYVLLIPVSLISLICVTLVLGQILPTEFILGYSFSESIKGIAILFLGRFLPVIAFVFTGFYLSPKRTYAVLSILATKQKGSGRYMDT
jgi:hypothetical protein